MTKRDILWFLFRYKSSILGWWVFVVAIVTVLTYFRPPAYIASGTVLVERTKAPIITGPLTTVPEMAEAMNTEIEIVRSRPVIEAVVDEFIPQNAGDSGNPLGAEKPSLMERLGLRTAVPPREAWIENLTDDIKIKPIVDSNIMTISYGSRDPNLAMLIVNAVTESYIAYRSSLVNSRGASKYFETKLEEASIELDRLRQLLSDYMAEHSVTSPEEAKAELLREVGRIRDRIATLNTERSELLSLYSNDHPRVTAITDSITAQETELTARNRDLRGLESRQSTINDLNVRISAQETIFLDYRDRYEQERAREAVPENLINVQIIEYASAPARPNHSRIFYIKIAMIGGFVLSLLIAFLRQYFNHRVERPEVAEAVLGVPVIGSLENKGAVRRY